MIRTKPKVIPEGFYNVTEAAAALEVDRHTIYRYEEAGCIKFQVRKAGRRRVTSGAQIIRCWEKMY